MAQNIVRKSVKKQKPSTTKYWVKLKFSDVLKSLIIKWLSSFQRSKNSSLIVFFHEILWLHNSRPVGFWNTYQKPVNIASTVYNVYRQVNLGTVETKTRHHIRSKKSEKKFEPSVQNFSLIPALQRPLFEMKQKNCVVLLRQFILYQRHYAPT